MPSPHSKRLWTIFAAPPMTPELWTRFIVRAAANGQTITAALTESIAWYVDRHAPKTPPPERHS